MSHHSDFEPDWNYTAWVGLLDGEKAKLSNMTEKLKALCTEWRRSAAHHRSSCALHEQKGNRDKADRHYQRSLDLDSCARQLQTQLGYE